MAILLVAISLVAGIALGQRFKILILVPVIDWPPLSGPGGMLV